MSELDEMRDQLIASLPRPLPTFPGITRLADVVYADLVPRANDRGFATVHAYFEWRTALRADYALATATPARAPATYLPIMMAFRTVSS